MRRTEKSYTIMREIIHVPTVRQKMEDGYDYIRLSDFGQTSGDEVRKALLDGQAKGAKGYILDLRDNGGGLVDAAVEVSSYFIPQGTIVSTIDRDGQRTTEEALGDAIRGLHPLVDSGQPVHCQRIRDHRRRVTGRPPCNLDRDHTFGKGVVQSIFPLPGQEGALKITTARYVTPAGRDIQHHGIDARRRRAAARFRALRYPGRQTTSRRQGTFAITYTLINLDHMKRLFQFALAIAVFSTMLQLPAASATPSTLSTEDASEISTGYEHLTADFYKKVESAGRTRRRSRRAAPSDAHRGRQERRASGDARNR